MTPANLPASRYHVVHETIYRYESPVSLSRQMLHLTPRDCHWQRCLSHQITVAPERGRMVIMPRLSVERAEQRHSVLAIADLLASLMAAESG